MGAVNVLNVKKYKLVCAKHSRIEQEMRRREALWR